MTSGKRYRAGESIEDYCRACKTDRIHTVMVADSTGEPIRVVCDYCRSEHNYRGGPRIVSRSSTPSAAPSGTSAQQRGVYGPTTGESSSKSRGPGGGATSSEPAASAPGHHPATSGGAGARATLRGAFPLVSDRERIHSQMSADTNTDLELLLRRVIREETGLTAVVPADKWRGGSLVLRPGTPGLQEKSWPIETFFHKVVMLRNRLRTLEQHVNASDLPDDVKVKLQGYITGCYGSLTSFNVLFAEEDDQFKGSGGE
jgi:hypothetical protein